jgi:hypothetical protein
MDKFLQVTIRRLENGDYYFDYKFDNTGCWWNSNIELVPKDKAETKLLHLFELSMMECNGH